MFFEFYRVLKGIGISRPRQITLRLRTQYSMTASGWTYIGDSQCSRYHLKDQAAHRVSCTLPEDQIHIEIASDVSCPWCIIGYRELMAALRELELEQRAEISWRPFELNPAMPPEGQNIREHIRYKYGITEAQSEANRAHIIERGAAVGFEFNYQADSRIFNTFDAHRLLHWAGDKGKQTPLKLALFTLYFQQGGNPSDSGQLVDCAGQVGLDPEEASKVISTGQFEQEVREEQEQLYQWGIHAVPAFVINRQHLISGAQPQAVLVDFFKHQLVA